MPRNKFKRAQIAMTDLFIALFIATVLIIAIIFTWNRYSTMLDEEIDYREMQVIAFQTADLLVKSEGEPEDWENSPNNAQTIGLASSDRIISSAKLDAFLNLSANVTSKSLGIELYDFYFKLRHMNGSKLAEYGNLNANKSMVNAQRLVLYKNEKAVIEFALWK